MTFSSISPNICDNTYMYFRTCGVKELSQRRNTAMTTITNLERQMAIVGNTSINMARKLSLKSVLEGKIKFCVNPPSIKWQF